MYIVGEGTFDIIHQSYHLRLCQNGEYIYSDIYSGALYQHHFGTGFLSNRNNISLIFNTDGIPVFKSSNFSFWPLYLLINELPYKLR